MSDTIKPAAIPILRDYAVIEGASVRLTCGQLDPKTYKAVNEVLERAGGKWNRKARAHLFDSDPTKILETIIHTGELPAKNPFAFFETPAAIVQQMIAKAGSTIHHTAILEPSAGDGAICDEVARAAPESIVQAIEIDPERAAKLRNKGYQVLERDFLTYQVLSGFKAILMNPPFAVEGDRQAYITHIEHAYVLLAPQGGLVAIAPIGFTYRSDRRCVAFRDLLAAHGGWEVLPDDAFTASGTNVKTALIWLTK